MKTAKELIQAIDTLSVDEQKSIRDYLIAKNDEDLLVTKYSQENMALLDEEQERSKRRIEVEEYESMNEARKALRSI